MPKYRVERYGGDGDYKSPEPEYANTLAEARRIGRRKVGGQLHGPRWVPDEAGAVEAWHESRKTGCGGVAIYDTEKERKERED